jgi:hypothetical protein
MPPWRTDGAPWGKCKCKCLVTCAVMNNETAGEPQEKFMQITADRLGASATTN